jgi:hypothetical protein
MLQPGQSSEGMAQNRVRRFSGKLRNKADSAGVLVEARVKKIGEGIERVPATLGDAGRSDRASNIGMKTEAIHMQLYDLWK